MGSRLRIGEVLRSGGNRDPATPVMDGHRNIHHVTASGRLAQIQLSKGINPIAETRTADSVRRLAILIRSSPWKAGTAQSEDEGDETQSSGYREVGARQARSACGKQTVWRKLATAAWSVESVKSRNSFPALRSFRFTGTPQVK
ncbi:hypothetical protein [Streptomyces sp. NPDC006527]|uniref:hypothetical protein n=1 Tax=Streptomyces sp. NPDC006527 TaxID=3364749 RepID=UPI0036CBA3A1